MSFLPGNHPNDDYDENGDRHDDNDNDVDDDKIDKGDGDGADYDEEK